MRPVPGIFPINWPNYPSFSAPLRRNFHINYHARRFVQATGVALQGIRIHLINPPKFMTA
jgi:hypothetical protein